MKAGTTGERRRPALGICVLLVAAAALAFWSAGLAGYEGTIVPQRIDFEQFHWPTILRFASLPFAEAIAKHAGFSLDTPFADLSPEHARAVLHGTGDVWLTPNAEFGMRNSEFLKRWGCRFSVGFPFRIPNSAFHNCTSLRCPS